MDRWLLAIPLALGACGSRAYQLRVHIDVYDRGGGQPAVTELPHRSDDVPAVLAVSSGAGLIATGGADVRVWDGATGALRAVLRSPGSDHPVTGLAFASEPQTLLVARRDAGVIRWNLRDPSAENVALEGEGDVALGERGQFAVADPRGLVQGSLAYEKWSSWNVHSGYEGSAVAAATSAYWNPNFAVADEAGSVFVGGLNRTMFAVLEGDNDQGPWSIALSRSGDQLAAARAGSVIVWNAQWHQPRRERWLVGYELASQACGCFGDRSQVLAMRYFDERLVIAESDGAVSLMDAEGMERTLVEGHGDKAAAAFSRNGGSGAFIDWRGEITVFDLATGVARIVGSTAVVGERYGKVAVSADGAELVVRRGNYLERWNLRDHTAIPFDEPLPFAPYALAYASDGGGVRLRGYRHTAAIAFAEDFADVVDLPESELTRDVPITSRDGSRTVKLLRPEGRGGTYRIVTESTKPRSDPARVTRAVTRDLALALSPDGFFVAAVDDEGSVSLYEAKTLKLMSRYEGHAVAPELWSGAATKVVYGDSGVLAFPDPRSGVALVKLDDGARSGLLDGIKVEDVAFSGDGRFLAITSSAAVWFVRLDPFGVVELVRGPSLTGADLGARSVDGTSDGVADPSGSGLRVGTVHSGRLVTPDRLPSALKHPDLLDTFLDGVERKPPHLVRAPEAIIEHLSEGKRFAYANIEVLSGSGPMRKACVTIETVAPVDEHHFCTTDDADRRFEVTGRPNIVRVKACGATGCTREVRAQWDLPAFADER